MCTVSSSGLFDVADDIFGLGEVDPVVGAELHDELVLLLTTVDGDYTATHVLGILDSKMAKSSTSTGNDNPVSGGRLAVFQCAVNGNTLMRKPVSHGRQGDMENARTAQRMEAAASLLMPSGMGVTQCTYETR